MASSSSSSSSSSRVSEKCHVFLSFRGEDTRDNFTSHLYAALCSKKINTFIDTYDLERGDEISEALLNGIEESMIAVIVFSKGYATSRWCLEELAKIIECKKARDLMVVPVFYQVDPSHVRNQKGTFGEAFVNHEEKQSSEKVMRWRNALKEAANLSGFDSSNIRPEAMLIEEIVKEILEKLNKMSPCVNKDLVGIESKIEKLESLLRLELKDVCSSVGIWGMGGIGKTTLACALFTKISSHFESVYFQSNVKEESEKFGLIRLSQELLSAILEDRWAILESTFTKSRFHNKKVLIVFDDVTCSGQIEKLIGHLECFGPGSRIIITARDKQVLKNCGVSHDNIYEVEGLPFNEALILFSRHAFKLDHPPASYMDLSIRVIKFAQGVPLALKVLGSSLFEKTNSEWESALYNLERNPNPKIQDVLKISYDGLDDQEKSIFLDIACSFKGVQRNYATEILDDDDFSSKIGVCNLVDKSLISIDKFNRIVMHDLLRKMGEKIIKQESKDPSKRSRLWHHDDIYHVLRRNTGTEAIECISLDISKIKEINLECNAFLKMQNLRFLDFYCLEKSRPRRLLDMESRRRFLALEQSRHKWVDFYCDCYLRSKVKYINNCSYCSPPPDEENVNKVHALQALEFSSSHIRYFRWFRYPLDSLPSNFELENLVALIMPSSKIKQLWNGLQHSEKLKHINLIHSKHLIRVPDLSMIPNLESLILEGCTSLIEVHSSIQYLNKLVILNLKGCKSLGSLPTDIQSKFLRFLVLSGCSNLKKAPKITYSMERVDLDGTSITKLPPIEHPSRLESLDLEDCSRLESLPSDICELKTLTHLFLTGCSNLHRFPNNLGQLEQLLALTANYTAIRELPHSILSLNKLGQLCSSGSRCQELLDSGWPHLSVRSLDLSNCQITRLPDSLGQLSSLTWLNLSGNNFEWIPSSIKDSRLRIMDISYCERLKFLPKLPSSVHRLQAYNCTSLESCSDSKLLSVPELNFGNCFKLDNARSILKAREERVLKIHFRVTMFLPGNEIPEWLSFQNVGSSITLELPLAYLKNDHFVSFIVCLVVTFPDHDKTPESFSVRYKLIAKDQYGKTELRDEDTYVHRFKCYSIMSDHVILTHFQKIQLGKIETRYVTFDFSGENYNVKKCGLKLYFNNGVEEQVKQYEGHLSSNMEEEPQPKRLKL